MSLHLVLAVLVAWLLVPAAVLGAVVFLSHPAPRPGRRPARGGQAWAVGAERS